jgi:uncharacterized membrane protein
MTLHDLIAVVARALEAVGVAVVALGGAIAVGRFAGNLIAGERVEPAAERLRQRLARTTLLALEFLVAADIIGTVTVPPTPAGLAMLAGIIGLRSFLSAALILEIEGRWPWTPAPRTEP